MNEDIYGVLQCDSNKIKNLKNFWVYFNQCSCDSGISCLSDIYSKPSCDGDISDLFDIIGVGLYFDPKGKHICALDEASKIIGNDLFLVSKLQQLSNDQTEYNSYKITYQNLSSQLMLNILEALKVGSMAYEEKWNYAISAHNHNKTYSKVNFQPNPLYQRDTEISTIGILHISTDMLSGEGAGKYDSIHYNPKYLQCDTVSYNINVPKISVPIPPRPLIGTLKFIGIQTMKALISSNSLNMNTQNVNPYDGEFNIRKDFDGWVFPNGSSLYNYSNQLSDAAQYYSSDGLNIVLPNVQDFIRCGAKLELTSKVSYDQKVVMPEHTHVIDSMHLDGDLSFNKDKCEILNTSGCGGDELFHQGSLVQKVFEVKGVELLFDQSILDGVKTTIDGEETLGDFYPTHNIVPIMIYIGGETREYYESLYSKYNKS